MKKMNLSKKQKIVITIATVILCTGGITTYTVISNNSSAERAISSNNIELYNIPNPEKIFIGGKLIPYNSKSFDKPQESGITYALNVSDGSIINEGTLLYTCENSQVINEIDDLKHQIELKRKEKTATEDTISKKILI